MNGSPSRKAANDPAYRADQDIDARSRWLVRCIGRQRACWKADPKRKGSL